MRTTWNVITPHHASNCEQCADLKAQVRRAVHAGDHEAAEEGVTSPGKIHWAYGVRTGPTPTTTRTETNPDVQRP